MTTALEGVEGTASRPDRSLPLGKTRYPLYRRLGGPQGRSGQVRKILPPPGFDPRNVQPVASRYTDNAFRPTISIQYRRYTYTSACGFWHRRNGFIFICSSNNLKRKLTNIFSGASVRASDVITWCHSVMSHVYFRLKLRRGCEFPSTLRVKPTRCTIFSNYLILHNTVHVSDGLSVHHQELKTVCIATGICQTVTATCLLAGTRWTWFNL